MNVLFNPRQIFSIDFLIIFSCAAFIFVINHTKNNKKAVDKTSHSCRNFNSSSIQSSKFHLSQRGGFWVIENYAQADSETASYLNFKDLDSITLTTQCDPSFLAHLTNLVERWRGPISVTVYAPGSDFDVAAERIHFLRECSNSRSRELIRKFVSFHLFFDLGHIPENIHKIHIHGGERLPLPSALSFSCSKKAGSFLTELEQNENRSNFLDDQIPSKSQSQSYRHENGLVYPINVARNIAREMSNTLLVLPSDIELYPSVDFIPNFLQMLQKNPQFLNELKNPTSAAGGFSPRLFVVPTFELLPSVPVAEIPKDKDQLVKLYEQGDAKFFLFNYCSRCFDFPGQERWVRMTKTKESGQRQEVKERSKVITVFDTVQRVGKLSHWEPFYVGTKNDPSFDERLSWEGRNDKHPQGFALCLLNSTFHILDGAFLVHFPGIHVRTGKRNVRGEEQYKLIQETVLPELRKLYGDRTDCSL